MSKREKIKIKFNCVKNSKISNDRGFWLEVTNWKLYWEIIKHKKHRERRTFHLKIKIKGE